MRLFELTRIHEASVDHQLDPVAIAAVLSDRMVQHGLKLSKGSRIWRGISGNSGTGMAVYGLGLYTTTSREKAKSYAGDDGEVVEMTLHELPEHPLRFATVNDFQIWYGQSIKKLGFASKLDVGKMYPDFADFIRALEPSIDGIQIGTGKDAIFVLYGI